MNDLESRDQTILGLSELTAKLADELKKQTDELKKQADERETYAREFNVRAPSPGSDAYKLLVCALEARFRCTDLLRRVAELEATNRGLEAALASLKTDRNLA